MSGNLIKVADHAFTTAVSQFASYVDCQGEQASSPGGFKTQINKRMKAAYGMAREDMSGVMKLHGTVLLEVLTEALRAGMAQQLPRRALKDKTWYLITLFGQQWQVLAAALTEDRLHD